MSARQHPALLGALAAVLGVVSAACVHAADAPPITLHGEVQYETFGYPDSESQSPGWENFFAALVRGNGAVSSALTYQFEAKAVADDVGFTAGGYSWRNASRRRPYLSLITAVVDFRPLDELRVSVGKQIVNWSLFDELQPANLMTPRDESDVFRRTELGVPGVAVRYGLGNWSLDLMVVPLAFTPSRLPQGRWNIIQGGVDERQEQTPVRLNETQAGGRLGARIGQLEASIIGYVGRDGEAIFVPRLIFVGGDQVFRLEITDRYPRLRAGGATASYPLGEHMILRSEVVHFSSPDLNRDDFLHSIAGVEYALDDWRVILNYLRDDRTSKAAEEVTSTGEERFFRSFLFGELRYDAGRALRARFRAGYDMTDEFMLLQPEISYRVWSGLTAVLFAEIIDAHRPSYFDNIRHEDRVGTRLEYHL